MAPTLLEATGLKFREEIDGIKQMPLDGTSMVYAFDSANAPEQHTRQYFELFGNRAMYLDGWKAVTIHGNRMPWKLASVSPFEDDVWELYNIKEDFSESNNLADKYPEKLDELKKAWDDEAFKYNVYPLHDDMLARLKKATEVYAGNRDKYVYYPPGAVRIPDAYSPPVKNMNHSITAYATVEEGKTEGVLLATGGIYGGYTFFIKDGKLWYDYNAFNEAHYIAVSDRTIPSGEVELKALYTADKKNKTGVVELFINGEKVGEVKVERIMYTTYSISETTDVGVDMGAPVSKEYDRDNKFRGGVLDRVVVEIL